MKQTNLFQFFNKGAANNSSRQGPSSANGVSGDSGRRIQIMSRQNWTSNRSNQPSGSSYWKHSSGKGHSESSGNFDTKDKMNAKKNPSTADVICLENEDESEEDWDLKRALELSLIENNNANNNCQQQNQVAFGHQGGSNSNSIEEVPIFPPPTQQQHNSQRSEQYSPENYGDFFVNMIYLIFCIMMMTPERRQTTGELTFTGS